MKAQRRTFLEEKLREASGSTRPPNGLAPQERQAPRARPARQAQQARRAQPGPLRRQTSSAAQPCGGSRSGTAGAVRAVDEEAQPAQRPRQFLDRSARIRRTSAGLRPWKTSEGHPSAGEAETAGAADAAGATAQQAREWQRARQTLHARRHFLRRRGSCCRRTGSASAHLARGGLSQTKIEHNVQQPRRSAIWRVRAGWFRVLSQFPRREAARP